MEKKSVKKIVVFVVILTVLITAGIVIATDLVPSNAREGFRTNHTTRMQVWAVGDCQHINNTGATYDYFIPTRTSTELNSFKAHPPTGVTSVSCTTANVSVRRIASWTGWVNMHTNDSGVWVHDPDCTSGTLYSNLSQCQKWWPETYSYQFHSYEHIYGWRAGSCASGYLENWTKPTYTCNQCTELLSYQACYAQVPFCHWHTYGSKCTSQYCGSYGYSTDCTNAGCYWYNGMCYAADYCSLLVSEDDCSNELTRIDGGCCWVGYCSNGGAC